MASDKQLQYHENTEPFRDAINFTESNTGFSARLIEKDYYCSLVLRGLTEAFQQGLIFKGGTCLSDVSTERLTALQQQIESRLKPVLRTSDFNRFDLERVFEIVASLGRTL